MESLALEELELYIKSQSVHGEAPSGPQREEELFDRIMQDTGTDTDPAALDASFDASLEANLDANLDLNLDVNLDVSGGEHNNLELAWDFLEAEATIGELNTPTHSPGTTPVDQADFQAEAAPGEAAGASVPQVDEPLAAARGAGAVAVAGAGETSLAMSHATLTALLAGNALDGLEIPDGLL